MKRYRSKIGWELISFLVAIFGLVGFLILKDDFKLSAVLAFLSPIFFTIYLFNSIEYIVEGNQLNVRAGFLINEIGDINSITKISETNNPLSAPAASLDRLEINFKNRSSFLISPNDKHGFIDHLLSINPEIEVIYKS